MVITYNASDRAQQKHHESTLSMSLHLCQKKFQSFNPVVRSKQILILREPLLSDKNDMINTYVINYIQKPNMNILSQNANFPIINELQRY